MPNYRNVRIRPVKDGSHEFYDHDDRRDSAGPSSNRNRDRQYGNYRGGGSGRRGGYRDGRMAHSVDADGDISMGGDDELPLRNRFNPYSVRGSSGGSQRRRNNRSREGFNQGRGEPFNTDNDWFAKVIIPYARRLDNRFVLNSLFKACPVPFIPFNYHHDGNSAVFYVEDSEAAKALSKLTHTILTPDGQQMAIIVRFKAPVSMNIPKESINAIKECIGRRYNPTVGALDLSNFRHDMVMKANGIYLPLNRRYVSMQAVQTVRENITNLTSLNLEMNNFDRLNEWSSFITKMSNLKVLLLANNSIVNLGGVDCIKGIEIEELSMNGNPVVKGFKTHTDFVEIRCHPSLLSLAQDGAESLQGSRDRSLPGTQGALGVRAAALRKRFPKLVRLDGAVLPPQIGFDVENTAELPVSLGSYFVNESARAVSVQFLKQYFAIYDSNNRDPLVDAYHTDCRLALSYARFERAKGESLSNYIRFSCNLLIIRDNDKRERSVYQGRDEIVSLLKKLPGTQHDPGSFSVDVTLAASSIMTISACGVFKEMNSQRRETQLRAFSRTFVIVPNGLGFNIVNEVLCISIPTQEQRKAAFKTPAPTPSTSPVPGGSSTVVSPSTAEDAQRQMQQQMVAAFSQQSGMTAEWSFKCLLDNGWEFEKAASVFKELHALGRIPAEAFV